MSATSTSSRRKGGEEFTSEESLAPSPTPSMESWLVHRGTADNPAEQRTSQRTSQGACSGSAPERTLGVTPASGDHAEEVRSGSGAACYRRGIGFLQLGYQSLRPRPGLVIVWFPVVVLIVSGRFAAALAAVREGVCARGLRPVSCRRRWRRTSASTCSRFSGGSMWIVRIRSSSVAGFEHSSLPEVACIPHVLFTHRGVFRGGDVVGLEAQADGPVGVFVTDGNHARAPTLGQSNPRFRRCSMSDYAALIRPTECWIIDIGL